VQIKLPKEARHEWRSAWPIVAVSTAGYGIAAVHIHSLGVLVRPIEAEFGWGRAEITGALLPYSIATVVFAPLIGHLIDRFGVRRMGVPGMAAYCTAVALLASTADSLWNWWALWLLIAMSASFIKPTLWSKAVGSRFEAGRGLALGVMLCGSSLCATLLPPITHYLVEEVGWRGAYLAIAGSAALLMLPLLFVFLRDEPARSTAAQGRSTPSSLHTGLTVRRSLLSSQFLRLGLAAPLMLIGISGLQVNFVPITTAAGLDAASAAMIAGAMGVSSIAGRLIAGLLLDRFHGSVVGAISFLLPVVAVLLLLNYEGDRATALTIAVILGVSLGSEYDTIAYMATRYFGLKNFGVIYGVITGLFALGWIGPSLAGLAYDNYRSYDLFLWCVIPAFVLAAIVIGSLGPYPTLRPDDAAGKTSVRHEPSPEVSR
jgi:predicted MFS family arabinose efflux permease